MNIANEDFDEIATYIATTAPHLSLINHSNEHNIDITAKYINKFTAIESILGSQPAYIAFGNDHNDIEMLQHAKIGYFVNNQIDVTLFKNENKIQCIDANTDALCLVLDQVLEELV